MGQRVYVLKLTGCMVPELGGVSDNFICVKIIAGFWWVVLQLREDEREKMKWMKKQYYS